MTRYVLGGLIFIYAYDISHRHLDRKAHRTQALLNYMFDNNKIAEIPKKPPTKAVIKAPGNGRTATKGPSQLEGRVN